MEAVRGGDIGGSGNVSGGGGGGKPSGCCAAASLPLTSRIYPIILSQKTL